MAEESWGPYLVLEEIGSGAMGEVFLAWHPDLRQRYAVKTLKGPFDDAALLRFRRELESLALLDHPNIVRIHSAGVERERPYFVMDYHTGATLRDRLKRGPLDPVEAADLLVQVADGVAHSHERGVAHRDLKPENILLDADGRPTVSDFGLAWSQDENQRATRSGEAIGTPVYMAPEQALGLPCGPAADVYALGVLLFECLEGRPPLTGATPREVQLKAAQGQIDALSEAVAPRALAELYREATRLEEGARLDGAAAFARRLRAYLHAARSSAPRRSLALPALAIALSLIVLTGGGLWLYQAREEERRASAAQRAWVEVIRGIDHRNYRARLAQLERGRAFLADAPHASPAGRRSLALFECWIGRARLAEGDVASASDALSRCRGALRRQHPALLALEVGLASVGRDDPAASARAEAAIAACPADAELHGWAAALLLRRHQPEDARRAARRAGALGQPAPRLEALAELALGNEEGAIAVLEAAGLEDKAIEVPAHRRWLERSIAGRRYSQACRSLERLRALDAAAESPPAWGPPLKQELLAGIGRLTGLVTGNDRLSGTGQGAAIDLGPLVAFIRDLAVKQRCLRAAGIDTWLPPQRRRDIEFAGQLLSDRARRSTVREEVVATLAELESLIPDSAALACYRLLAMSQIPEALGSERFLAQQARCRSLGPLTGRGRRYFIEATTRDLLERARNREALAFLEQELAPSRTEDEQAESFLYVLKARAARALGEAAVERSALEAAVGSGSLNSGAHERLAELELAAGRPAAGLELYWQTRSVFRGFADRASPVLLFDYFDFVLERALAPAAQREAAAWIAERLALPARAGPGDRVRAARISWYGERSAEAGGFLEQALEARFADPRIPAELRRLLASLARGSPASPEIERRLLRVLGSIERRG